MGSSNPVSSLIDKATDIIDPVAQAASFIPSPVQPYAQAYTGLRGAGVGGDDYGGLQIGGFTPSGSMFNFGGDGGFGFGDTGTYGGMSDFGLGSYGPLFDYGLQDTRTTDDILYDIGERALRTGIDYGLGYLQNQFMPPPAPAPRPTGGISTFAPFDYFPFSSALNEYDVEKKLGRRSEDILKDLGYEKGEDTGIINFPTTGTDSGNFDKIIDRLTKVALDPKTIATIVSTFGAYLSYKDRQKLQKKLEDEYNKQQGQIAVKGQQYRTPEGRASLAGYRTTPARTKSQIVSRPGQMGGGILNSRMGYQMGGIDALPMNYGQPLQVNQQQQPMFTTTGNAASSDLLNYGQTPLTMTGGGISRLGMQEGGYQMGTLMNSLNPLEPLTTTGINSGLGGFRYGYAKGTKGTKRIPIRRNKAGVKELDFRPSGGFVPPIGIKEKADDIPAMLSNNEFVFTADAVRGAGKGDVKKGAKRMYALMKQLEAGGIV